MEYTKKYTPEQAAKLARKLFGGVVLAEMEAERLAVIINSVLEEQTQPLPRQTIVESVTGIICRHIAEPLVQRDVINAAEEIASKFHQPPTTQAAVAAAQPPAADEIDALRARIAELEAENAELAKLPTVLFDGYAVLNALDDKARARIISENVSDVLDAVVKLMRTNAH